MSIIIFDTETTGLFPGNICQIAYIVIRDKEVRAKNYYFSVDYMDPEAENVHHLSIEMLRQLSKGCSFEIACDSILKDFNDSKIVIAHNYAFDSAFMRAEALRNGGVYSAKGLCTMNKFRDICKLKGLNGNFKNPKLDELLRFLNITDDDIYEYTNKLFGTRGLGKHDARVDTAALALIVLRAAQREMGGLNEYPQITALECI